MIISIVGCGHIGSWLAFILSMHNIDNPFIDKIKLYDNDIIELKNLPYLYCNNLNIINNPKVCVLKDIIDNMNTSIMVEYNNTVFNPDEYKKENNEILIDCRDSSNAHEIFNIRLRGDINRFVRMMNPKSDNNNNIEYKCTYIKTPKILDVILFLTETVNYITTTDISQDSSITLYEY